ncbi:MAG: hypothetical protein GY792_15185 [Gammaproteobacteria bacterium]|nr:hypothetical protein [Gammaproteobacteria bacterium]
MESTRTIQGRQIGSADLSTIRDLIATHPDWHRTRLSQELCRRWGWVNEQGRLKDIAARALLRKLDGLELIELPAPIRSANNAFRNRPVELDVLEQERAPPPGGLPTGTGSSVGMGRPASGACRGSPITCAF